MAHVPEDHAPVPDALRGRQPRTDWLVRGGRVLFLSMFVAWTTTALVQVLGAGAEHRPGLRIQLGASLVMLAGAVVVVGGAFAARRWGRALRAGRAASSSAPWRRDGYWSAGGEKRFIGLGPSRATENVRRLLNASGWFAVLAAIALAAFRSDAARPTLFAGLASLAVVFVMGVRGAANVDVQWRESPARVGEAAHYTVKVTPMPGGRFERIDLTLRCVVETSRRGGLLRPDVACPFSATRSFADELMDSAVALHARFDVPAGLPAADPHGEPAVFWELAVAAERSGSCFEETFLVPVYTSLS